MNSGWLSLLAADHAPPAVGWWPPAPGWWAVALLAAVAAILIAAAVRWWHDPRRLVRRAALRELRQIRASRAEASDTARAIENLLRRHAIAVHGRERVARLAGRSWLDFLHACGAAALAGEAGPALLAAAFGSRAGQASADPGASANARADRERWLAAADQLIRRAGRDARRTAVHERGAAK